MRLPILLLLALPLAAQSPKALFYVNGRPDSVRSFVEHAAKIDIVAPTVYSVDGEGALTGTPDAALLAAAREHRVAVMPLIVNPGFRQDLFHSLVTSPAARERMIAALVAECRRYRYYGIQFDFENVALPDTGALARLFRETAAALRAAGYKLSIAVVPRAADPGQGDYARYMFENWRGPYDLKAIAPEADFISLMTYDQHTRHTPPGPIAGMPWVRAALDYALRDVPPEKLSLGIPLYGRRWYAGMRDKVPAMLAATVFGSEAAELAAKTGAVPQWDPVEASPWFLFHRDGIREWVFYTDARAFRARYDAARTRRLHGFSAWVLGVEDAGIWEALPQR